MAESVVQADYDNVLRDIKLWIMDLEGALGELAEAQRAAARRRAEIDARLAAAHPGDEEGLREVRGRAGSSRAGVSGLVHASSICSSVQCGNLPYSWQGPAHTRKPLPCPAPPTSARCRRGG